MEGARAAGKRLWHKPAVTVSCMRSVFLPIVSAIHRYPRFQDMSSKPPLAPTGQTLNAMKNIEIIDGNLLDQPVDVIVNAWNRNIIPWWLLLPRGVSGAIKKRAGYRPFWQLGMLGAIPLGGAVTTCAGRLPFKAIVHVAGIDMWWRASQASIQASVHSAMQIVHARGYRSVAFPALGSGTGGLCEEQALQWMQESLNTIDSKAHVRLVRFGGASQAGQVARALANYSEA
ncbi:O-acetyl-ADP-ribose deacetylase [compost metagenome]